MLQFAAFRKLVQEFPIGISFVNHCRARNSAALLDECPGRAYLPWLLFFFIASSALGQYVSQSWTTANGLPSNNIRAIMRARDGYLWMTTDAGIVRFDGVSFRVFSSFDTPDSLATAYSFGALLEEQARSLWAGTSDAGVVLYRMGIFRTLTRKMPCRAIVFFGSMKARTAGFGSSQIGG